MVIIIIIVVKLIISRRVKFQTSIIPEVGDCLFTLYGILRSDSLFLCFVVHILLHRENQIMQLNQLQKCECFIIAWTIE